MDPQGRFSVSERFNMRKHDKQRPYRPEFMALATLAYMLDISERTVQDYVEAGLLPEPVIIGNVKRWRWTQVEIWLDQRADQSDCHAAGAPRQAAGAPCNPEKDQYSEGVKRVAQEKEASGGVA